MNRTLYLTVKKEWFDLIKSGEKKEEYREIKQYWTTRFKNFLIMRPFDFIVFRNGYGRDVPEVIVELIDIDFGFPKGGLTDMPLNKECYVLKLGKQQ